MRWIFMFLVVLNVFYCIWHQQQAPLRPQVIAPLELYQGARRDIQLLSEKASAQGQPACLFLGGFAAFGEAQALERRLLALGVNAKWQQVEAAGATDYWVYLPPLASRQASQRQMQEIQALQINSHIIAQGDQRNGISLGMYVQREAAEAMVRRLDKLGYGALLKELPRVERGYWVRVVEQSRALIDEAMLKRLSLEFKGLRHQLMSCEGLARRAENA